MKCAHCKTKNWDEVGRTIIGYTFWANLCTNCANKWEEFIQGNEDIKNFNHLEIQARGLYVMTQHDGIDRSLQACELFDKIGVIRYRIFLLAKNWIESSPAVPQEEKKE